MWDWDQKTINVVMSKLVRSSPDWFLHRLLQNPKSKMGKDMMNAVVNELQYMHEQQHCRGTDKYLIKQKNIQNLKLFSYEMSKNWEVRSALL